jgi:hypothetical protein
MHESEDSDPTLLMWDPATSLLAIGEGVPHVITGTVRHWEPGACQAWIPLSDFYYLDVESADAMVPHIPSASHPYFTIPEDYRYRYWIDIVLYAIVGFNEPAATIGLVTERYSVGGHDYVRIQLMERVAGALPVRVTYGEPAPDMGSLALFCGTKRPAGGDDLHPSWLPLRTYLDTTDAGEYAVRLLQGSESIITEHEMAPSTLLGIQIDSPADIHLYDGEGHHVGPVYDASGEAVWIDTEIPDAVYVYGVDAAPEALVLGNPIAGAYTVTIRGTSEGAYTETVTIYGGSGGETYRSTLASLPTSPGQEDSILVDQIPAAPTGLQCRLAGTSVHLTWDRSQAADLVGYNLYRSTGADKMPALLNETPIVQNYFTGESSGAASAYYFVTAIDADRNESGHLTPVGPCDEQEQLEVSSPVSRNGWTIWGILLIAAVADLLFLALSWSRMSRAADPYSREWEGHNVNIALIGLGLLAVLAAFVWFLARFPG